MLLTGYAFVEFDSEAVSHIDLPAAPNGRDDNCIEHRTPWYMRDTTSDIGDTAQILLWQDLINTFTKQPFMGHGGYHCRAYLRSRESNDAMVALRRHQGAKCQAAT